MLRIKALAIQEIAKDLGAGCEQLRSEVACLFSAKDVLLHCIRKNSHEYAGRPGKGISYGQINCVIEVIISNLRLNMKWKVV